jgi:hypothetical protein
MMLCIVGAPNPFTLKLANFIYVSMYSIVDDINDSFGGLSGPLFLLKKHVKYGCISFDPSTF